MHTTIGTRIKEMRLQHNLSVQQLAEIVGKSKSNISGYENDKFEPSAQTIISLSKYFNVSTDWILKGEEFQNQNPVVKIKIFDELDESILEKVTSYAEFLKYKELSSTFCSYIKEEEKKKTKKIPIIGETAAGNPIHMDEPYYSESELIEVPESSKAKYALRVRGDSMEPEIKNNQIIFIKEQPTAENGQVVVVALDTDTITCKKFYKFPDRIELRSINPFYLPRIVDKNDENFRIIGIVIDNETTA